MHPWPQEAPKPAAPTPVRHRIANTGSTKAPNMGSAVPAGAEAPLRIGSRALVAQLASPILSIRLRER